MVWLAHGCLVLPQIKPNIKPNSTETNIPAERATKPLFCSGEEETKRRQLFYCAPINTHADIILVTQPTRCKCPELTIFIPANTIARAQNCKLKMTKHLLHACACATCRCLARCLQKNETVNRIVAIPKMYVARLSRMRWKHEVSGEAENKPYPHRMLWEFQKCRNLRNNIEKWTFSDVHIIFLLLVTFTRKLRIIHVECHGDLCSHG